MTEEVNVSSVVIIEAREGTEARCHGGHKSVGRVTVLPFFTISCTTNDPADPMLCHTDKENMENSVQP